MYIRHTAHISYFGPLRPVARLKSWWGEVFVKLLFDPLPSSISTGRELLLHSVVHTASLVCKGKEDACRSRCRPKQAVVVAVCCFSHSAN